jgi:glycosyltransferase involved in cell wall biosynthesis
VNLVLVSGIYFPDIGGPATYIPRLATQLIQNGHEVCTLSLTDRKGEPRPVEKWKRMFIRRNLPKPIRMFLVIRKLVKLSRDSEGIYANGLHEEAGIATLFGSRALVAKIVGDPIWERYRNSRKTKVTISEFQTTQLPYSLKYQRKLLVWSLNRFKNITTPSTELAEIVRGWGVKPPIKVIQNGITCRSNKKGSGELEGVLSVSRLVTWKNIDILIRACANQKLKLVVIGDGPERDNLEILGRELNSNVEFLGELDNKDVISVLDRAEVYALISDYEGLSFSLLEAMMAGKPIVVSNNPGNLDVIENLQTGLIVPIRDLEATEDALAKLIHDKRFAQELGDRAQHRAQENYCEETQLNQMIDLISESSRAK